MTPKHTPVLLKEIQALFTNLISVKNPTFVDATFGEGHYSRMLLNQFPGSTLFAVDRDPEAVKRMKEMQREFG